MFEQSAEDAAVPADWVTRPPDPELARALAGLRPAQLSDDGLLDAIAAWERLAAWTAAGQLAAIAEFARRRPGQGGVGSVSEFAADEVAVELSISRNAAGTRMALALDLAQRLRGTAAALASGTINLGKARTIAEATEPLDESVAAAIEAQVLPRAGRLTIGRLRAALARLVLRVDPTGAEERHQHEVGQRRVVVTPGRDGMAELWAWLPADGATAIFAAIDRRARQVGGPVGGAVPDDGSGMDARRADALVELVTAAGAAGDGRASGAALVHVTVPASVVLGRSQEPGELAGYGPIPTSMALRLAAGGRWRRLLTDPTSGTLLDLGNRTYLPSAALAEHVRARDVTCRFPGCRQPARPCDLDHTMPFPDGPTAASNLGALCRHHHRVKHETRWSVRQDAAGVFTWTSPTGRIHVTAPPPYP